MNNGLAALLAALTVATAPPPQVAPLPTPTTTVSHVTSAPVLYVHGYIFNVCPGGDVSTLFAAEHSMLQSMGYTGPADNISYYACDTKGSVIWQHGDSNTYFPGGDYALDNTPTSRGGATDNTDIRHISYQLAWYIYDTYSSKGQTVNLVAHSMGGLITNWMLYQEAQHNPLFPPYLYVQDSVTVSTPYDGVNDGYNNISWCPGSTQCTQLKAGSALTKELHSYGLNSQATNGTDWTAIGGAPCDTVDAPDGTTINSGDTHKMWYFVAKNKTPNCYSHTSYLTDTSTDQDMPIKFRNPGDSDVWSQSTGYHSLKAIAYAVLYSNY